MDNNNPARPNSFCPGSNYAFKMYKPNKEAMLRAVMQKKLPSPQTWGQVYFPPINSKRNVYNPPQVYKPPFDKSDYWINFPAGSYRRTPAPLN